MSAISPEPIHVLCVEDERFISELYVRAMSKEGYEVTVARSGIEALEKAKTNFYDIILLDIMVPDMLGTDMLDKLHAQVPDLKAKVIITTNLEQDPEQRSELERKSDGYIIKAEITPKQLVDYLDRIKFD